MDALIQKFLQHEGPFALICVAMIVGGRWVYGEFKALTTGHKEEIKEVTDRLIKVVVQNTESNTRLTEAVRSLGEKIARERFGGGSGTNKGNSLKA